jgi:hypothetical protein
LRGREQKVRATLGQTLQLRRSELSGGISVRGITRYDQLKTKFGKMDDERDELDDQKPGRLKSLKLQLTDSVYSNSQALNGNCLSFSILTQYSFSRWQTPDSSRLPY